jgi:hypothetical protein
MNLIPEWKKIIRKAWSVRLMVLAGLLSGCEVILPLYSEAIPRNAFAVLSMLAIAGGFIARLVAQKGMNDGAD